MQVRSLVTTVGIGMVAGAAAILMIPRNSEVYRVADDAAHSLKQSAEKMMNNMKKN